MKTTRIIALPFTYGVEYIISKKKEGKNNCHTLSIEQPNMESDLAGVPVADMNPVATAVPEAFSLHSHKQSAHWAVDVTAQVVPC